MIARNLARARWPVPFQPPLAMADIEVWNGHLFAKNIKNTRRAQIYSKRNGNHSSDIKPKPLKIFIYHVSCKIVKSSIENNVEIRTRLTTVTKLQSASLSVRLYNNISWSRQNVKYIRFCCWIGSGRYYHETSSVSCKAEIGSLKISAKSRDVRIPRISRKR